MNRSLRQLISRENIHILGIIVLLVGMPFSRSFMTIGLGLILANWVIDPRILLKLRSAITNKLVLSFLGIMLIHFIGLIWTDNFGYAMKDMRVKLPLIILPLIFSTTKPLSTEQWRFVFKIFVIAILFATFRSMFVLYEEGLFKLGTTRKIAKVISHIRFALYICIVIFVSIYILVFRQKGDKYFIYWGVPVVLWLVVFLFILKSLTGFVVLGVGMLFIALYYVSLIRHYVFRFISYMFILGFFMVAASFLVKSYAKFNYRVKPTPEMLLKYTESGNKYMHKLKKNFYENGNFVYANICTKELRKQWNEISQLDYDGKDNRGHMLKHTLIRYMTSIGLNKDSVGISKLTHKDVEAIESGFANYLYTKKFSLYATLYKIFWELDRYKSGANPSGHSIVQRFYYMNAGLDIFKSAPIFGVGTGDVKDSFENYYEETNSVLSKRWRLRTHNQYITILLTFGVVGFIVFLWGLFYPIIYKIRKRELNFPALIVFGIILLSMLNEDTIETQAGGLLVAFFYAFFVWGVNEQPIPKRSKTIK